MITKRIVLHFPVEMIEKPITCSLAKEYNLDFTILRAFITLWEEGLMVLELRGEEKDYEEGMEYLTKTGVRVQPLSDSIIYNKSRCTQCGACANLCPTGALSLEPSTKVVSFNPDKCIACEFCIKTCPPRAMEVNFDGRYKILS
ncbi:MAG: 4Fe-4S binding protein [Deltaproteobacteria bacterium]|nr:MAG: 4Fe-4S binding protein [Deltaproteobacteria bacterium]